MPMPSSRIRTELGVSLRASPIIPRRRCWSSSDVVHWTNHDLPFALHDRVDSEFGTADPQPDQRKDMLHFLREIPEPVDQVVLELTHIVDGLDRRDLPIEIEPKLRIGDVVFGNQGRHRQIEGDRAVFKRRLTRPDLVDRLAEQTHIQFVSHGGDVPTLFRTKDVSCPPDFQISHRDPEPRTKLGRFLNRFEPLQRFAPNVLVRFVGGDTNTLGGCCARPGREADRAGSSRECRHCR